jgi:putative acetyltransferase
MKIQLEPPNQAEIVQLIDALDAYQKPLYPPESHHGIDVQALSQTHVLFAVARAPGGQAIGCSAVVLEANYGEIKRMYVSPTARGQGVGRLLLRFLEAQAQAQGCAQFKLETGCLQLPALALYARCGYVRCGPFGAYAKDATSVFMCKEIATSGLCNLLA